MEQFGSSPPAQELGALLLSARLELEMSQEDLARRVEVNKSTISRLERGRVTPQAKHVRRIYQVLSSVLDRPTTRRELFRLAGALGVTLHAPLATSRGADAIPGSTAIAPAHVRLALPKLRADTFVAPSNTSQRIQRYIHNLSQSSWAKSAEGSALLAQLHIELAFSYMELFPIDKHAIVLAAVRTAYRYINKLTSEPNSRSLRLILQQKLAVCIADSIRCIDDELASRNTARTMHLEVLRGDLVSLCGTSPLEQAVASEIVHDKIFALIDRIKDSSRRGFRAVADKCYVEAEDLLPQVIEGPYAVILPPLLYEARARSLLKNRTEIESIHNEVVEFLDKAMLHAIYSINKFQINLTKTRLRLLSQDERHQGESELRDYLDIAPSPYQYNALSRIIKEFGIKIE